MTGYDPSRPDYISDEPGPDEWLDEPVFEPVVSAAAPRTDGPARFAELRRVLGEAKTRRRLR